MDEFEKWFKYKSEGISFDRNHKLTAKAWALEAWKEFQKENIELREELEKERELLSHIYTTSNIYFTENYIPEGETVSTEAFFKSIRDARGILEDIANATHKRHVERREI